MASTSLVFDILARDNASRSFQNIGNAAERAGNQTSGFGASVTGAMKLAGAALIGGGLISGFKALYSAADESRKIGALTAQVIQSTGGAANVTAEQVGNLAAAIAAKTGIDDEAIQSGQNLLLTFTNVKNAVGAGNDIFNQATQIMTDMSVALGTDASGSAIQLGKALNDPIKGVTALTRVGVSFTESQKDQIRVLVESGNVLGAQKIILQELGREFGGAAEAAATPLDKLQVKIGNLAEDIGGYLIPIVDELATWFGDDLLPAAEGVAEAVGTSVGPAFHLLWDALKEVVSVGGDIIGFFNDLPGPIQAGVVALGAVVLLKGPVTDALQTIALKTLYAKDAIAGLGSVGGAAKAGLSGLVSFLGGPWGVAILATVGSFALLSSTTEDNEQATQGATEAQRSFADALRESNGVIDESVRRSAAQSLQADGLLDIAEKAGISLSDMTDAILGNAEAYDVVSQALEDYKNQRLIASGYEEHGSTVLHDQADAAELAIERFDHLAGTLGQTAEDQQQLAVATGEASVATAEASEEAQKALEEWRQKLQNIAASFVEPAGIYQDLVQEMAQATADDTADASDSWSDYVDTVDVSLDELADRLQEQLDNQANWRDNLAHIAQWAGQDVANYLAEMGEEGVDLVAQMADGTTAGAQDMREQILRQIQAGGAEWTADMDDSMKVMAAIGTDGARKTVQGLAAELGIGADKVREISDRYGLNLAEGVNPLLLALGKPVINAAASRRGGAQAAYNADGNVYEDHSAQIAHGGAMRVWAEPETGGESYIPHAASKRPRSLDIWRRTGRILGAPEAQFFASGGFLSASDVPRPSSTAPYGPPLSTAAGAAMGKEYDEVTAWLKNNVSVGPTAAAGVQRWLPVVLQSLSMMGQPASLAQTVLRRMNQESGGNPSIVNRWDSNWLRGTPSVGLMQVIGPTYSAYADSRRNVGPYLYGTSIDPLANILASEHYAIARYGSLSAAYNKAGGYQTGIGYVPRTGFALLHEGERVVTREQNARQYGAGLSAGTGSGGGSANVTVQAEFTGDLYLESGEFLGKVRGVATDTVNGRLEDWQRRKVLR